VLGAVEEEVLEEVREAGATALLVARTDVVPEVHRDQRHAVVLKHDHAQAVVERERLVLDRERRHIDRLRPRVLRSRSKRTRAQYHRPHHSPHRRAPLTFEAASLSLHRHRACSVGHGAETVGPIAPIDDLTLAIARHYVRFFNGSCAAEENAIS
jgi:hypothetical protein